jgi:hypothetical protein
MRIDVRKHCGYASSFCGSRGKLLRSIVYWVVGGGDMLATFTPTEARGCHDKDWCRNRVNALICQLLDRNMIVRVDRGRYRLPSPDVAVALFRMYECVWDRTLACMKDRARLGVMVELYDCRPRTAFSMLGSDNLYGVSHAALLQALHRMSRSGFLSRPGVGYDESQRYGHYVLSEGYRSQMLPFFEAVDAFELLSEK